jgi:alpha(1,3/1,4) fucosyltransferase
MKTKVKIKFAHRNEHIRKIFQDAFFGRMTYLFDHFDFVYTNDPDFVIYGHPKSIFPTGKYIKIFYTPENVRPPMHQCDWAFSFDYDEELKHPRHMRLPIYTRLGAGKDLIKTNINASEILESKIKFCCFIYYNCKPKLRSQLFDKLSKYKKVDAPGRCKQNMPPIEDQDFSITRKKLGYHWRKTEFLKPYKFNIAFENTAYPGYTTEKLYHPMLANCIPIYWGNPLVHRDFNRKSIINLQDFKNMNEMVDYIVELDKNDSLYMKKLEEPWYPNNQPTPYVDHDKLLKRFKHIFKGK